MRKRIYFNKVSDMKYISHLDLIRFLERIFKRAHIDIKYSQGFHPRPKMSFLNPISLGTEAYNEPMEIELNEEISNEDLKNRINNIKILGFCVTDVEDTVTKTFTEDFSSINYSIKGSKYDIDKLEKLLHQNEIIEEKEKNGKITRRNLKERLVSFEKNDDELFITLINMSPNAFLLLLDITFQSVNIKRLGYNKCK